MNPRKKPSFRRQEWFRMGNQRRKWLKWRRTRGNQSKLRMGIKERGARPHPGWGAPAALRGLHPSGLAEVAVMNLKGLENLDPAKQAIRIGHGVGSLARLAIQRAAEERRLKVLNPRKIEVRRKAKEAKSAAPGGAEPQAKAEAAEAGGGAK